MLIVTASHLSNYRLNSCLLWLFLLLAKVLRLRKQLQICEAPVSAPTCWLIHREMILYLECSTHSHTAQIQPSCWFVEFDYIYIYICCIMLFLLFVMRNPWKNWLKHDTCLAPCTPLRRPELAICQRTTRHQCQQCPTSPGCGRCWSSDCLGDLGVILMFILPSKSLHFFWDEWWLFEKSVSYAPKEHPKIRCSRSNIGMMIPND